jgi:hypothetical protein
VRLSRIRLFPKVSPRPASRLTGSNPRSRQRETLEQILKVLPVHPALAPTP